VAIKKQEDEHEVIELCAAQLWRSRERADENSIQPTKKKKKQKGVCGPIFYCTYSTQLPTHNS
jgi:hypothetical protein